MLGLLRTIALVLITVVATVFFIQNLASTEVAFITWVISAPRAVVFLLIFAFGWIAGWLVAALRPRRKSEPPPVLGEADRTIPPL